MKKLTINIEDDLHHAFACYCAQSKRSMSEIVRSGIAAIIADERAKHDSSESEYCQLICKLAEG